MAPALQHSSAHLLEFGQFRELLLAYASSPLGRARIASLAPSTDRQWIEQQQELTSEIHEFRRTGGRFEFAGLLDVSKLAEKSRISGAALETEEIRDVIIVVDRAAEWREISLRPPAAMKIPFRVAAAISTRIVDFTEFLRGFRNKILPDGTLEDRASPQLAAIRREIEKQRRSIQKSLRTYLRRLAEDGAAQDELVTIPGKPSLLPLKVHHTRRVPL